MKGEMYEAFEDKMEYYASDSFTYINNDICI